MSRTFIRDKECIVYRILKEEQEILIIDCETKRLPFWITREELEQYADVSDYKLPESAVSRICKFDRARFPS